MFIVLLRLCLSTLGCGILITFVFVDRFGDPAEKVKSTDST